MGAFIPDKLEGVFGKEYIMKLFEHEMRDHINFLHMKTFLTKKQKIWLKILV